MPLLGCDDVPSLSLRTDLHDRTIDELQRRDRHTWDWFAQRADDPAERDRHLTELLKSTVRLDLAAEPRLAKAVERAATTLGIELPVTLYRGAALHGSNASIAPMPDRLHVILTGPIDDLLDDDELAALMGHELAHALLWSERNGELLIADRLLAAAALQSAEQDVWVETARRFRLMLEIACDRGAYEVCGAVEPAIGALVKSLTGNARVDGARYLDQSREILSREGGLATAEKSRGVTHPEGHIRALALDWWRERGNEASEAIARLVEGPLDLVAPSLLDQRRIGEWTREAILGLLRPAWRRTEATLAHADLFLIDFGGPADRDSVAANDAPPVPFLVAANEQATHELIDYACFLLLDFAVCDRNLGNVAIAQALRQAEAWGIDDRFEALLRKELDWRKRSLDRLKQEADRLLADAENAATSEPETLEASEPERRR